MYNYPFISTRDREILRRKKAGEYLKDMAPELELSVERVRQIYRKASVRIKVEQLEKENSELKIAVAELLDSASGSFTEIGVRYKLRELLSRKSENE